MVTPVRNQADCGACWAFSTVEVLESMKAIQTGNLTRLSVQEVCNYQETVLLHITRMLEKLLRFLVFFF